MLAKRDVRYSENVGLMPRHENLAPEHALDGTPGSQSGLSATCFDEAIRFVKLDTGERSLHFDARGSVRDGMRFCQLEEILGAWPGQ